MAVIAVTGSSGFIGSHLVKKLREKGHELLLIDIAHGYDVTDFEKLRHIQPFEIAVHLAAKMFVPDAFKNPLSFYNTNVQGTLNVLELCRLFNARMIFPGSYVYGQPEYLPVDELHPVKPFNPYAQSKLIGEQLCEGYFRDFDVPVVILRPFNPYGQGQHENFLIPKLVRQAKEGKIKLDDPRPKRDFVYIDDLVSAFLCALDYSPNGPEVFNIGSGTSYSVAELVDLVVREVNPGASVEFTGIERKNEVLDTIADISRAKKLLNWNPVVSLADGIKMMNTSTS